MPIRTMKPRYSRVGKLSAGLQVEARRQDGSTYTRPAKSETWVAHADAEPLLVPWAARYGGTIVQTPGSGERFHLVTETTTIPVLLPHVDLERIRSQYLEAWAKSGLVRRCDGIDCIAWRMPPTGDEKVGAISTEVRPCICETDNLPENERCKPTVRLSVLPADIWRDIPALGVWEVHSTGWNTNSQLDADLELIDKLLEVGPAVRLNLRIVQVNSRHGDVPMIRLDLDGTPAAALELAGSVRMPALEPVTDGQVDEPVGTFIDTDPLPEGEVVSDALTGTPSGVVPATPAAPSFAGIGGITITRLNSGPHAPATDRDRMTHAQHKQLKGVLAGAKIDEDALALIFETRYGLDLSDATRQQATSITQYLRDQIIARDQNAAR